MKGISLGGVVFPLFFSLPVLPYCHYYVEHRLLPQWYTVPPPVSEEERHRDLTNSPSPSWAAVPLHWVCQQSDKLAFFFFFLLSHSGHLSGKIQPLFKRKRCWRLEIKICVFFFNICANFLLNKFNSMCEILFLINKQWLKVPHSSLFQIFSFLRELWGHFLAKLMNNK